MPKISHACVIALLSCAASSAMAASRPPWPPALPVYDHVVLFLAVLGQQSERRPSRPGAEQGQPPRLPVQGQQPQRATDPHRPFVQRRGRKPATHTVARL